MKVVILAAGVGSRFEEHDAPKALLPLANERTLLGTQLDAIARFVHLDNVIIVVGYHQEMIRDKQPHLSFVENPDFKTTNTAKSLLLALNQIEEDQDLLWVNGDVVFHPSCLHRLIAFDKTALVVNTAHVEEEEIKYLTDGVGRITEISKTVSSAQGEAIGINLFKADDVPILKAQLMRCSADDYFEKGIQYCIDQGMEILTVPIDQSAAVEVDFPEDLDRANELIQSWKF